MGVGSGLVLVQHWGHKNRIEHNSFVGYRSSLISLTLTQERATPNTPDFENI